MTIGPYQATAPLVVHLTRAKTECRRLQEGIEVGRFAETKGPAQVNPGAFERWLGFGESLNRSYGHLLSPD
jgi:hypothetical protein